jgi:hypothetical protein
MRRVAVFLTATIFFLSLATSSSGASLDLSALFPIEQNGKWGFIDRSGKVVVSPRFQHAGDFHEGQAGVKGGLA